MVVSPPPQLHAWVHHRTMNISHTHVYRGKRRQDTLYDTYGVAPWADTQMSTMDANGQYVGIKGLASMKGQFSLILEEEYNCMHYEVLRLSHSLICHRGHHY